MQQVVWKMVVVRGMVAVAIAVVVVVEGFEDFDEFVTHFVVHIVVTQN